jgi:hypothetical protein
MKKQDSAVEVVPNWTSVWHLLDCGQPVLARLFRERWQLLKRGDWTPNSPAARAFFEKKGPKGGGWPAFQAANQAQQVQLITGTPERWDISLLCLVLQQSAWVRVSSKSQENKAIKALRNARNAVAHTLPSQLPAQTASDLLQRVMMSLVALGENKAELERFLLDKQRGGIFTFCVRSRACGRAAGGRVSGVFDYSSELFPLRPTQRRPAWAVP